MSVSANPTSYLGPGDIRVAALSILNRALSSLSASDENGAIRREPPPLLRLRTEEEQAAEIRALTNRLREDRPSVRSSLLATNGLVQKILDASSVKAANQVLSEVRDFTSELLRKAPTVAPSSTFECTERQEHLTVKHVQAFKPDSDIMRALAEEIEEQYFVASVMQMCSDYRRTGRRGFGPEDELALERAYRLLEEGVRMPRNYQPIRTDEHRPFQTYLSFADPGDGHLSVTVREADLLEGLIVHIEYIDRDNVDDKALVEAYRLPAVRNAARVRLHVGSATPCTAFIGRPVFESGTFSLGLLKAGHTMASVCSAMFAYGIADCKLAMDGRTAKEAVEFMRVVAGNVIRDPLKQRLSAAFNVNSPLTDDLFTRGVPKNIDKPEEIASLAVRLAKLGGFHKVALDGASDERPSKPIVGRLTRVQLLKAVHEAHQRGLETYISAGMTAEHMRDAVYIGVGGVGIGTSLHYSSEGTIGEIDPNKVRQALKTQKASSETICGKAARRLAQLDWRYADGTLMPQLNGLRQELFKSLSARLGMIDEGGHKDTEVSNELDARLQSLLKTIDEILAPQEADGSKNQMAGGRARQTLRPTDASDTRSPSDLRFEDPAVTWAYRLLDLNASGDGGPDLTRQRLIAKVNSLLLAGDVEGLHRLYPL